MSKINLSNTTLIAATSDKISETLKALKHCMNCCSFYDVKIFTHTPVGLKHKIIKKIESKRDYDNFIIKKLPYEIESEYCLTIQYDGFIVNPNSWTDEFFDYDYIGAPWPWLEDLVGNGGFCLKSKKFLECQKNIVKDIEINNADDVTLSEILRDNFISVGCKYAPSNLAYKFSTEHGSYEKNQSFGFHDFRLHRMFEKKFMLYKKAMLK